MKKAEAIRCGGAWLLALALIGAYGCSGDDDAADDGNDGPTAGDDGDGNRDGGTSSGSGGSGSGSSGTGSGSSGTGSGSGGTGTGDGGMITDGGVPGAIDPRDPTGIIDGGWMIPDELLLCSGEACECADGQDNDGDGKADGFDIECTGPADDDEGSFATGISGDNRDPYWQDCFFDGNSGAGNDGCRYHTECLTGEREASSDDCTVSEMCVEYCSARTPNGCDCFGCCTVTDDNGDEINVVISDQCDADDLTACASCTPTGQCGNECGECELCPGRSVSDLPASCFPPPPGGGTGGNSGGSGTGGSSGGSGTGGSSGGSGTGGNSGGSGTGGNSGGSGTGGSAGSGTPVTCNGMPLCFDQTACPSNFYCYFACCTPVDVE